MEKKALFLDRDGVINVDHGHVHRLEDFAFVDGIFDLCRSAQKLGYLIIVATNQAGIGRGYYTEEDFHELTKWMCNVFSAEGVTINGVYFCPYHPTYGIGKYKIDAICRKPNPGMLLLAAQDHGIDLSKSVLIGDKESDIQAGISAGVKTNLLLCKDAITDCGVPVLSNLHEALRILR